jgi:hypothetical protein
MVGTDPNTGEVRHLQHNDCGFVTVSEAMSSGDFRFEMTGRPPQNEQDTESIGKTLAEALSRADGRLWLADSEGPEHEEGIDWYLRSGNDVLPLQVTRVVSQKRWDSLGASGEVEGKASASEGAAEIWAAIERKLLRQDERTVLALIIRHPGFHGFSEALAEFHDRYDARLQREVRFAQVWAVGYGPDLTHLLYRRR